MARIDLPSRPAPDTAPRTTTGTFRIPRGVLAVLAAAELGAAAISPSIAFSKENKQKPTSSTTQTVDSRNYRSYCGEPLYVEGKSITTTSESVSHRQRVVVTRVNEVLSGTGQYSGHTYTERIRVETTQRFVGDRNVSTKTESRDEVKGPAKNDDTLTVNDRLVRSCQG